MSPTRPVVAAGALPQAKERTSTSIAPTTSSPGRSRYEDIRDVAGACSGSLSRSHHRERRDALVVDAHPWGRLRGGETETESQNKRPQHHICPHFGFDSGSRLWARSTWMFVLLLVEGHPRRRLDESGTFRPSITRRVLTNHASAPDPIHLRNSQ